jgi:hypothetical protein
MEISSRSRFDSSAPSLAHVLVPVIALTWIVHQLNRFSQPLLGLQERLVPIADTTILVVFHPRRRDVALFS